MGIFSWRPRSTSGDTCIQSIPVLCYSSLCSIVPDYSISGQWRSWSNCADAQADLSVRCPHMHIFRRHDPYSLWITKCLMRLCRLIGFALFIYILRQFSFHVASLLWSLFLFAQHFVSLKHCKSSFQLTMTGLPKIMSVVSRIEKKASLCKHPEGWAEL